MDSVRKDHRHLSELQACTMAEVVYLHLESIAVGAYFGSRNCFDPASRKTLKAGGAVMHREAKQGSRNEAAAGGDARRNSGRCSDIPPLT